jgi:8-oxo-dGTP pyrophosphatase MutT (NUDIX family)
MMGISTLFRRLFHPPVAPDPGAQAQAELHTCAPEQTGVIPWRRRGDDIEYLLITSRRSARWIFPKGGVVGGMTPWDSAALEALEESGVEGEVSTDPIGRYGNTLNADPEARVEIELYALEVLNERKTWPEKHQRKRRWVRFAEAVELLGDPDKADLLAELDRRLAVQPVEGQ